MKTIMPLLLIINLLSLSCEKQRENRGPVLTPMSSPNSDEAIKQLKTLKLERAPNHLYQILVNTELSKYDSVLPKSTFVRDYIPADRGGSSFHGFMYIKFDGNFIYRLPEALQAQLKQEQVFDPKLVDIFLIVQAAQYSAVLIGREGSDTFTRLAAHTWADPEMPANFSGTRLKRDFLFGLFEAEEGVADEIPLGSLKAFEVHTHDHQLSPPTGRIRINPKNSYAFYSLVIGDVYPTNIKRANVTLHWLLNEAQSQAFFGKMWAYVFSDGTGKEVKIPRADLVQFQTKKSDGSIGYNVPGLDSATLKQSSRSQILHSTMGEFLTGINEQKDFKNTRLAHMLNKLAGYSD